MPELTPETLADLYGRFEFPDGIIQSFKVDAPDSGHCTVEVVISARDELSDPERTMWHWLTFRFEGVIHFRFESVGYFVGVMLFPIQVGFFADPHWGDLIWVDFQPNDDLPSRPHGRANTPEDFRNSIAMVAAKRCSWSAEPYRS